MPPLADVKKILNIHFKWSDLVHILIPPVTPMSISPHLSRLLSFEFFFVSIPMFLSKPPSILLFLSLSIQFHFPSLSSFPFSTSFRLCFFFSFPFFLSILSYCFPFRLSPLFLPFTSHWSSLFLSLPFSFPFLSLLPPSFPVSLLSPFLPRFSPLFSFFLQFLFLFVPLFLFLPFSLLPLFSPFPSFLSPLLSPSLPFSLFSLVLVPIFFGSVPILFVIQTTKIS